MGLLDKLFGGGEPDYPALDESSPLRAKLDQAKDKLEELVGQINEPMEVIPSDSGNAYVFIGKPPKKFGIAWIENGEINNFKTLLEKRGASPITLEKLSNRLREAYEKDSPEEKYTYQVGQRKVVVLPSESLAADVRTIIEHVANK